MSEFEIIITADGSPTIYSKQFKATYHSQKGAMQESLHVFIKNGFDEAIQRFKDLKILEIGFGTGLNALLSLQKTNIPVYYQAVEKFPLPKNIFEQLDYGDSRLTEIHECNWNEDIELSKNFILHKINSGLEDLDLEETYHLIYLDAFAPSTQGEIWQKEMLQKLYNSLVKGGILVTFCAQGEFKRSLKSLGFTVESPPGAAGKREMTRAIK